MEKLLRAGLNIHTTFDTETTRNSPLHWAATFGTAKLVKTLVEDYGAEVNTMNSNGDTPLHEAVNRIDLEIAEILLRNGSDVRIKSSKGYELLDSYLENRLKPGNARLISKGGRNSPYWLGLGCFEIEKKFHAVMQLIPNQ